MADVNACEAVRACAADRRGAGDALEWTLCDRSSVTLYRLDGAASSAAAFIPALFWAAHQRARRRSSRSPALNFHFPGLAYA